MSLVIWRMWRTHERSGELPLIDMVFFIGRSQNLRFIDVINSDRLEHLRFDKVADPGFGHDRNRHGADDLIDHLGGGHTGDSPVFANIGGHPFEGHDGHRSGVLSDLGLLCVDDIHDDAAFEHFR